MLVISRCAGERLRIGPDITITVVKCGGGKIRLGIDAPRELDIARELSDGTWSKGPDRQDIDHDPS